MFASKTTDLKATVDALKQSQAVIEFNMDGTVIDANPNFLAVVGYSLPEIKGRHHSMFVEPDYARSAEYKEFWAKLANAPPDTVVATTLPDYPNTV